ncbi:MAG: hypothetical protein BGO66_17575 [Alicycliphilus sp. 69-12]|nr:MAG: hypothetical protein BGO66_17575 [Alicycliphilus sp. 69-12]
MTNIVTPPTIDPMSPAPLPTDTPSEFDAKAFARLQSEDAMVPQINAANDATYQNALAAKEYATAAAASASSAGILSNFKGRWDSLTGALAMPATVLENGAYWMLLQDLPDVAAVRPGTNPAVWTPQILEARALGAVDLNTVVNSGDYTAGGALVSAPPGVTSALINVTRAGDVAVQLLHDTGAGAAWVRMASALTTAPAWTAWGRISQDNTPAIALAGGAMDCSKGTYFTETIGANRTLAFSNIPDGAYACVLEVYHTGGVITLPAGSVWVAGAPPTLSTPRRHLFFFQRAITGSGGWIVSCLPNSAI